MKPRPILDRHARLKRRRMFSDTLRYLDRRYSRSWMVDRLKVVPVQRERAYFSRRHSYRYVSSMSLIMR